MNTLSWLKCAMLASVLAVGQSAVAERASIKMPKLNISQGDIVKSAVYDKEAEVVVIEIESNNACNFKDGSFHYLRSGRATFGPHIYKLSILSTMMNCGKRSTTKIRVPLKKERAQGVVQFQFGSELVAVEGLKRLPNKAIAQPDSSGNSPSESTPKPVAPPTFELQSEAGVQ